MVWTTPKTWVAGALLTEGALNVHLRDNLLQTLPALATAAGQHFVTTGLNSVASRSVNFHSVSTSETTTSTAFTDLATIGPTVTITTGSQALALFAVQIENNTVGAKMSVVASSTWTDSVINTWSVNYGNFRAVNAPFRAMSAKLFTGLTPGNNTLTCKYAVGGGTGTFSNRTLIVVPL